MRKTLFRKLFGILLLAVMSVLLNAQPYDHGSIPAPFNVAAAMKLLYGNFDPATGYAEWRGVDRQPGLDPKIRQVVDGMPVGLVAPLQALPVLPGLRPADTYVLLTETKPADHPKWDCHACPLLIGAAVFRRHGDRFVLAAFNPYIAVNGTWGKAGPASVMKWGEGRHFAVLLKNRYEGSGEEGYGISYLSLVGPQFVDVLDLPVQDDLDESLPGARSINTVVEYRPGADPDFPDIVAHETGWRTVARRRQDVSHVTVYRFRNGRYAPVNGEQDPLLR